MRVAAVVIVALVVGFLLGLLFSDVINPTLHDAYPHPGATRAIQRN